MPIVFLLGLLCLLLCKNCPLVSIAERQPQLSTGFAWIVSDDFPVGTTALALRAN
jgi:hypothetical protein